MKKIIPFKKDIIFKTNLSEITSISLEHELSNEGENVHGTFIVSGKYKIADTSINVEQFSYELPFDIRIDERYDVSKMTIDIDDFYYEVINNNILSVNIDVSIDKLEEKPEELPEHIMKVEELDLSDNILDAVREEKEEIKPVETTKEELDEIKVSEQVKSAKEEEITVEKEQEVNIKEKEEINIKTKEELKTEEPKKVKERCIEDEEDPKKDSRVLSSIFDNLDDATETYQSYHVYIVRDGDSLEYIMKKYEITKEELECYNDLSELKVNDKIIIPAKYAES